MDIEITKEPRLRDENPGEHQHVQLPIEARPRVTPRMWIALSGGALTCALSLVGVVLLLPPTFRGLAGTSPPIGFFESIIISVSILFMIVFVVCFVAAVGTLISDKIHLSKLTLDSQQLFDSRSLEAPLPWSKILHARIIYQDKYTRQQVFGAHLKFRQRITARHNPFRFGTLGLYWTRKPDELYVPLAFMSVSAHVLGHTILALVRMHGGSTDS